MATIDDCRIVRLQNQIDSRGGLVIAEATKEVPFDIKRVFYSFNIPDKKSRGAHAHRSCKQFLIAPTGSFIVEVDDGFRKKRILMDDPLNGLYVPPGVWASELEFEPSAICLVFASELYDESDYIRSYEDYLIYAREER